MPRENLSAYKYNSFSSMAILIDIVIFCWIWTNIRYTAPFTFQLIGVLVVLYLLYHYFFERAALLKKESNVLNTKSFILCAIIILFVSVTGGINSPFFFLLYFLTIGVSLLLHPLVSVVLVLSLLAYFVPELYASDYLNYDPLKFNIIRLGSLFMIIPLAIFFAKEYLKVQEQDKKIMIFKDTQKLYKSELDKIKNSISSLTFLKIKSSLSNVKSYSYILLKGGGKELTSKQESHLKKIYESNEQALKLLESYEKSTEQRLEELEGIIEGSELRDEVVMQ